MPNPPDHTSRPSAVEGSPDSSTTGRAPPNGGDPSLAQALALLLSRDLDDPMEAFLALAGQELQVSRAYLFQLSDDGERMSNTHEWCAPGVPPEREQLQDLPTEQFRWWMERLAEGPGIQAESLADLPAEAANEREILQRQGVSAVLALPLRDSAGRLRGFMGFDEVDGPRPWASNAVETLALICEFASREMERQAVLSELRRMQDRLMRTESIARVGGWEFEPDAGESWWSSQARTLLSIPSHAPNPTLFDFLQRIHPLDRDRARAEILQIMDNGQSFRFACRLVPGDPSAQDPVEHVQIQGELLSGSDGRRRVVGTIQDLTLLRTLEQELHQAQRVEMVGRMAGGVAHDFNRLLSIILTGAEFLLDEAPTGARHREDLEQIREAARAGAALTDKLLTLSRANEPAKGPVEVNPVIRGLERLLDRILPPSLELEVQTGNDAGRVAMDGRQLEEILMALALNARDAMEGRSGQMRITTESRELAEPEQLTPGQSVNAGRYTLITVSDEGHGMTAAVQRRIFQPHFSTRENGEGRSLTRTFGIIQQAGGGIGVESEPERGSTFRIFLPTVAVEERADS
jgi:signal transduction histidine kinase